MSDTVLLNEIKSLTVEVGLLKHHFANLLRASQDLINNDLGNLRWLEAEQVVKNYAKEVSE
jgi:hypothetical protein